jgi:general stress protein 26
VEAWFPEGKDSPNVALLLVEADSAEYWDSPGGRIASALAFAKSKVTGEKPDVGESGSVEL